MYLFIYYCVVIDANGDVNTVVIVKNVNIFDAAIANVSMVDFTVIGVITFDAIIDVITIDVIHYP